MTSPTSPPRIITFSEVRDYKEALCEIQGFLDVVLPGSSTLDRVEEACLAVRNLLNEVAHPRLRQEGKEAKTGYELTL